MQHDNEEKCLCVTAPDVVGSALRTMECADEWIPRIKDMGFPVAFVCQDGQEMLPIPWRQIDAVFIGGSTDWKMGDHALHILKCARVMGKKTHVGRVNTPSRWKYFEKTGLVDTVDGTGLSRYDWMLEKIAIRDYVDTPLLDIATREEQSP